MYQVLIENRAEKEIESLPGEVLKRSLSVISSLKQNPRSHGVKKLLVEDGWRIRIGATHQCVAPSYRVQ